jgi:hypothetical protein
MSPSSVVETNSPVAPAGSRIAKGLFQVGAFFLWFIGSLFLAAGRLDWIRGWISVALVVVAMPAVGLIVTALQCARTGGAFKMAPQGHQDL